MILSDFRSILPRFRTTQEETIAWLTKAHSIAGSGLERVVARYVCKPSRISSRYVCLEDFSHTDWNRMRIFNLNTNPSGLGMKERMEFFSEVATETFGRFYAEEQTAPEEIIHVTCTGYISPSAAQTTIAKKNWNQQTIATHAYHMGCYAAIPAIEMAKKVQKQIDIVHTELCALHFNPSIQDPEQLVVQGLFADGLIRYSAFPDSSAKRGLRVRSLRQELIPETSKDMTWTIADHSIEMTLARDISKSIGAHLPDFVKRLCGDLDMSNALFAIHPGGPKIIDDICTTLQLKSEQVRHSEKVLFERGNMSSATLPHIWSDILDDPTVKTGSVIVSLAFGPGLTIAGAEFIKC